MKDLAIGAGVLLAVAACGAALAQDQTAPAQPQRSIQMVQAQAQLNKSLDAKKLKQGDPVTAKLEQPVTATSQQGLPKDTVLEGHVDQVEPSQNKSDSTLVVTFDKAKLKGGQELPIKATVIAISEPALAQQNNGGGMPADQGGPMPSGAPQGGSGAPTGGSSAGSAAGSSPNAPSAQPMPDTSNGQQQQQSQKGGVPDVTLKSDIHQHSSATFTSKGRNVHVPDGTQMEVAIAVVPPGVTLQ